MNVSSMPTRAAAPAADRLVVATGVDYAFRNGAQPRAVLRDIHLGIDAGEVVILTGPSGSGKTTLLTLIGALRSLQGGSLRVFGTELAGLAAAGQRELRRRIGFIFQDHNLFEALSVRQTLRLAAGLQTRPPAPAELQAQSLELMAALGLPQSLDARPRELSTGQKQRVAIARALINRPALILADEPTAALDAVSARQVMDLIQARVTRERAAALIVTHDARLFDFAHRIVHMEDGCILEVR